MMAINLLPWRAQAQRRQQRAFAMATLMVVAVTLLFGWTVTAVQQHRIAVQQERNQQLEQGIKQFKHTLAQFEKQDTQRRALQSRLGLVNQLQQQRNNVTAVLNFIPRVMPPGAYLTRIAQQAERISLEGWVHSNAELARLLASLETDQAVDDLDIETVVTNGKAAGPNKRFTLSFSFTQYVAPERLSGEEDAS
ncbi:MULTISPECIES: PilN domain-containing protein [Salinivibrio]|uniref:PilN domain-containing protein n=1 Tax=Salinivibrio TaxID=51366 RepID=UPI0009883ACA|nr:MULTISPECIES: PilN domain-containing protein [Salinivibrio]WBA18132.1 PilN domain-containing protein [Salinivibrio kushneri]